MHKNAAASHNEASIYENYDDRQMQSIKPKASYSLQGSVQSYRRAIASSQLDSRFDSSRGERGRERERDRQRERSDPDDVLIGGVSRTVKCQQSERMKSV